MIIKLTLNSHFKVLKKFRKIKDLKKIFLKKIFIFFLSMEFFLKNCKFKFFFFKKILFRLNLLKSPMRYKKFFNQVFNEIFIFKFFFYITLSYNIFFENIMVFFKFLNKRLSGIGTNLLTIKKFSLTLFTKKNNFFCL